MNPWLSYLVTNQVNNLTVKVVVPHNLVRNVTKAIYADREKQNVVKKPMPIKAINVSDLDLYTFDVRNPKLLLMYVIEWEFNKNYNNNDNGNNN